MKLKALIALGSVSLVALIACAVEGVQAKDYNQSCTKDDDCMLVDELTTSNNKCTISCIHGAINKRDQEKYATELTEERADCTSIEQPRCEPGETAICLKGTCESSRVNGASASDAGTD